SRMTRPAETETAIAGMQRAIEGIKRIEGDDGPAGNYASALIALRLALADLKEGQFTHRGQALLADARAKLLKAAAKAPSTARIHERLATVAQLEGNADQMTKHLQTA